MLLGVETDNERGNVDDLLADADVALANEDTGVVDGLGEAKLVDAGLETTLKEILSLEGKDVIELHAGLVKDTNANETANEGIAFEKTLGVLLVEGKKLTVAEVSNRAIPLYIIPQRLRPISGPGLLDNWMVCKKTYRAARRILERVKRTRQTSRLLRRPYSPTSFNSESLRSES